MARPKKIVPTYRKHSSGQARVTIDGTDYLLGEYNSKASKDKYQKLVAEWMASNQSPKFKQDPGSTTIADLLLAYVRFAKPYYGIEDTSEFVRTMPIILLFRKLYPDLLVSKFDFTDQSDLERRMISSKFFSIDASMCILWSGATGGRF